MLAQGGNPNDTRYTAYWADVLAYLSDSCQVLGQLLYLQPAASCVTPNGLRELMRMRMTCRAAAGWRAYHVVITASSGRLAGGEFAVPNGYVYTRLVGIDQGREWYLAAHAREDYLARRLDDA